MEPWVEVSAYRPAWLINQMHTERINAPSFPMHDSDRAEERYGGKDRGEGQGGKDRNYVITHPVGGGGLKASRSLLWNLVWPGSVPVT